MIGRHAAQKISNKSIFARGCGERHVEDAGHDRRRANRHREVWFRGVCTLLGSRCDPGGKLSTRGVAGDVYTAQIQSPGGLFLNDAGQGVGGRNGIGERGRPTTLTADASVFDVPDRNSVRGQGFCPRARVFEIALLGPSTAVNEYDDRQVTVRSFWKIQIAESVCGRGVGDADRSDVAVEAGRTADRCEEGECTDQHYGEIPGQAVAGAVRDDLIPLGRRRTIIRKSVYRCQVNLWCERMGRARSHAEFATRIALNLGFVTVDQSQQCIYGRCRLFLGEEVEGSDRGLGNQQGGFVTVLCNQDVTRNRQPEIEGRSRRCRGATENQRQDRVRRSRGVEGLAGGRIRGPDEASDGAGARKRRQFLAGAWCHASGAAPLEVSESRCAGPLRMHSGSEDENVPCATFGEVLCDPYPYDEVCIMISGRVALIDLDGNRREFSAGEAFFVPQSFRGTWETVEPSKKFFVALPGSRS